MSKESSSIYRLEHLDKFREYQKKYVEKKKQDENYLEKSREYQKEYHKKYDKTYKDQNRKKYNEYTKKYREKLKTNNKVLTELEEWLNKEKGYYEYEFGRKTGKTYLYGKELKRVETLNKIQELKEKYK